MTNPWLGRLHTVYGLKYQYAKIFLCKCLKIGVSSFGKLAGPQLSGLAPMTEVKVPISIPLVLNIFQYCSPWYIRQVYMTDCKTLNFTVKMSPWGVE